MGFDRILRNEPTDTGGTPPRSALVAVPGQPTQIPTTMSTQGLDREEQRLHYPRGYGRGPPGCDASSCSHNHIL